MVIIIITMIQIISTTFDAGKYVSKIVLKLTESVEVGSIFSLCSQQLVNCHASEQC